MTAPEKQLKGNSTELTAIARVSPGVYPRHRLRQEIETKKEWLEQQVPGHVPAITWLEYLQEPGTTRHMSWLEHLQAVLAWAHNKRQDDIRQMRTIHYARWVILDQHQLSGIDGPHLLFTSNFDGELEGYLAEFAEVDEGPLNIIFGHCIGWRGARPTGRFIQYVRDHQIPANVFYANYPRVRVGEVNRALHWKQKTDAFINKIVPVLNHRAPSNIQQIVQSYLNDLANPTSKEKEYPEEDRSEKRRVSSV